MTETVRYVSRIARLPLLDGDGAVLGSISDVILAPSSSVAPRVIGFVVSVQRRQIFVNAGRVSSIDGTGVRMRSGTIDVRPFRKREGELLALGDLVGQSVDESVVADLGVVESDQPGVPLELRTLALTQRGPLARRRTPRIIAWSEAAHLFEMGRMAEEIVRLREMRPADVASRIRKLPLAQRRGIEVVERAIMPEELSGFSECFLTGTAAEVTPVSEIADWRFTPGEISKRLVEDYATEVMPKRAAAE